MDFMMSGWWRNYNERLWRVVYVVLLGQLVSLALGFLSFNASLSANLGVDAPISLSFFSFLVITLVYGSILLHHRQKLLIHWYWYVLLGVVDVQGSYLANKAYQFSSITSVTILESCTIAWVIILTWSFLGKKYSLWQFLGVALCVTGPCLVLLSDSVVGDGGGSNPIFGDILVILATCFFALSSVGKEFCAKRGNQIEVITMLCLFGMLVSGIEMAIFERKNIESICWSPEVILMFVGYAIAGFMYESLTPIVLQEIGATLFNLSLLTADMWAVAIRVFFYQQKVNWLYYVSFFIVGIGLIIYSKTDKHSNELPKLENENTDQKHQLLLEEGDEFRVDAIVV